MKKVEKFIKGNIKTVIAFILGGVIVGGLGTYAAGYATIPNVSGQLIVLTKPTKISTITFGIRNNSFFCLMDKIKNI